MNAIASYLPPKVRATIYAVLATLIGLEAVWDMINGEWESKIIATLAVLGFGMAAVNATPTPGVLPPPDDGLVPEAFPGEFP
jgi:hypothetical protein